MHKPLYHIFTLSNGLRVVHQTTDSHVGYAGVVVNAGSRDEHPDCYGLAHFVEHTIFKGTDHRSGWHINNRMESIGGELNAYTSKEETLFFTNAPAGHTERSFELLYDLIAYANFPEAEVNREKDVVIEEIYSYLDNPSELVFDEFETRIFADSQLSHPILGTENSVKELTNRDCRNFIERLYRPANIVVYCASPDSAAKVERLAEKYFSRLNLPGSGLVRVSPVKNGKFNDVMDRDGHQAHTLIGTRVFGRNDSRRHALFLLNNYLGGPGMSSLLNQELREKNGLVYTVESNVVLLSDCGLWTVYFGSDKASVGRCTSIVGRTLEKLIEKPLSEAKLEKIKRQYIGQMQVATDQRESMAMSLGKSVSYYGEVHDIDWTAEQIMAITPDDMLRAAEMLRIENCSSLTIC